MGIFVTLGAIGFVMLLFSLVFDHDHDYEHGDLAAGHDADGGGDGPSWFNLRIIASFLAAFGAAGAIARNYDYTMMQSSGIGIGAGFVLGFMVYHVLGFVYRQQASSHASSADVLKQRGMVTVRILPGQIGEVTLSVKGSQYSYLAQAVDGSEIKTNTLVEVVSFAGETALVKPVSVNQ